MPGRDRLELAATLERAERAYRRAVERHTREHSEASRVTLSDARRTLDAVNMLVRARLAA